MKCEKDRKECPTLQAKERNILLFGECLWAVTMASATFMGKKFQDNQNSTVNTTDLTLKQMFGISAKLVAEQDEISNLQTIGWEKHSLKYLSLIGDERVINLQRGKVYFVSDSVLCLGKVHQHPNANESWKNTVAGIRSDNFSQRLWQRLWWRADWIRVEHFPRVHNVAALRYSHRSTEQIRRNTRKFDRKNSIESMFKRHFLWNERQWKRMLGKW